MNVNNHSEQIIFVFGSLSKFFATYRHDNDLKAGYVTACLYRKGQRRLTKAEIDLVRMIYDSKKNLLTK